jgi:hypothetical protein
MTVAGIWLSACRRRELGADGKAWVRSCRRTLAAAQILTVPRETDGHRPGAPPSTPPIADTRPNAAADAPIAAAPRGRQRFTLA